MKKDEKRVSDGYGERVVLDGMERCAGSDETMLAAMKEGLR
jgi:hypothetical protein